MSNERCGRKEEIRQGGKIERKGGARNDVQERREE